MKTKTVIEKSLYNIRKIFKTYKSKDIAISFNGGKDNILMFYLIMEVVKKLKIDIPQCIYFKERNGFKEVTEFVQLIIKQNNLNILILGPDMKKELFNLKTTHSSIKIIFMGVRQTDTKQILNFTTNTSRSWPLYVRAFPILDFSYQNVWEAIKLKNVPYCDLYNKGYTSLGSISNTLKNPKLLRYDNTGKVYYLHADQLKKDKDERLGRI